MTGSRAFAISLLVVLACTTAFDGVADATRADDEATAERLVLAADDLPESWLPTTDESDGGEPDYSHLRKIPVCEQFVAADRSMNSTPHADSPVFVRDPSYLANSVYVYPSVRAAERAMSSYATRDLARCYKQIWQDDYDAELREDPTLQEQVRSVKVSTRTTRDVDIGDGVVGFDGTVTITLQDGTRNYPGFGYWAVRVGRGITDFHFMIGSRSVRDALPDFFARSVDRLTRAF